MKRNRSVFPINTRSVTSEYVSINHEVEGGITFRDYIAVELFKGLLSNAAFVGHKQVTIDQLRMIALAQANLFVENLEEA